MRRWYAGLHGRERHLVILMLAMVCVFAFYLAILEPLSEKRAVVERQLHSQQQLLQRLKVIAEEVKQLRSVAPEGVVKDSSGQSLLTVIDRTSRKYRIEGDIKRLTPDGDNSARLWFESIEFDQLTNWLVNMVQDYSISVENLSVNREEDAGNVQANLKLFRKQL